LLKKTGIKQRQKYKKESKQLLQDTYNGHHPRPIKKSKKTKKRLRTIANTQLREPDKKLTVAQKAIYRENFCFHSRHIRDTAAKHQKRWALRTDYLYK
jgi:IS5 family transposase